MTPFRSPADFLGTWRTRSGRTLRITRRNVAHVAQRFDPQGNFVDRSRRNFDLMERAREAKS